MKRYFRYSSSFTFCFRHSVAQIQDKHGPGVITYICCIFVHLVLKCVKTFTIFRDGRETKGRRITEKESKKNYFLSLTLCFNFLQHFFSTFFAFSYFKFYSMLFPILFFFATRIKEVTHNNRKRKKM